MEEIFEFLKYHIKSIIIIILSIIIIVLVVIKINNNTDNIDYNYIDSGSNEIISNINDTINNKVNVDIKGAVKKPGVYNVSDSSLINDVIKLAGGLTKNATTDNINLSKKVYDEMVIYIFTKKELNKINNTESNSDNNVLKTPIDVASPDTIFDNSTKSNDNESTNNTTINENKNDIKKLININLASKEELLTLSGIGESKADAIIKYRSEKKFEKIEDIKNISGIGDSLFEKIKDYITV